MFGDMFDTFRKATEAAVQMQQEMLKPWIPAGVPSPTVAAFPIPLPVVEASKGVPDAVEGVVEQVQGFQKEWAGVLTEVFEKQRELVDAQYAYGIQVWKDAVQVALARDPEHFRKATEVLWKDSVEGMVTLGKAQGGECRELAEKVTGVLSKPVAAAAGSVGTTARSRKRG